MSRQLPLNCFLVFLLFSGPLKAQVNSSVPDYFDQFFNNYYLLNPANTDSSYNAAIKASDKTQIGLFQGVNKIYLDADLRAFAQRKEVFHFFGIQAINNRQGDYIHLSRLYGRYSWRTRITEKASLSAGISMGFVNYAFSSSQAGSGGSAFAPDGNVGIWYLREVLSIGISAQQLFNENIQPVHQAYILNRYYNLTARHLIKINPFLNIHNHLYLGYQKGQPINLAIASIFELQGKLEAGINYHHHRGLIFLVGFKKINIGTASVSFYLSWFTGTSNLHVKDNAAELFLSYQK